MDNGGQIPWNAVAICERSKTSWRMGKLHTEDDSENHWGTVHCFWTKGRTSSDFNKRSIETSPIWKEGFTWNISWICIDREGNLERRYSDCWSSEIYPRRVNAKEVLTLQKGEEFVFPKADGTAKLPGRYNEFREPTLRREQTVGSEDHSGELQGESDEPQPTESTDDDEARIDIWSIQGDFIYRHHTELRVQIYLPK